jgi:tetratricopeptide (TPR) repeat protein
VNRPPAYLAVLLLALAAPLLAREVDLPPAGQRWVTLEQDGFTFISEAPPARTLEIAYTFVGLRRAIRELVGPVRLLLPTRVYIFASARNFAAYRQAILQQKSSDTGITVRRDAGTFIVLRSDDPTGVSPFILHSLAHELIDKPHPSLPLWFREGLAEYFTSYRVVARQPQLGRALKEHVTALKNQKWIPAAELFSIEARSPLYDERTREGIFHAESWLFVHTLVKGDPKRRARLARFLSLTDDGAADTAFNRAFDLTPEDLTREAGEHLVQFNSPIRIRSLRPELAKLDELPAPKEMTRDAVLFELGYLLAASSPANASLAGRFVSEALRVNPSHARANALSGRLLEAAGQHEAAAKANENALRLGGNDAEVLLLSGEGVVERLARKDEVPLDEIRRARALFQKATRLDPDSPRPWMGLGATYVTTPDDPAPGIAALQKARAIDPTSEHLPFLLAELLARDPDRMDEAIDLGKTSLKQTTQPEVRLRLEHLLTEMESIDQEDSVLRGIRSAQEEVNADHLIAALRILDELLPRIEDPDLLAETRRWRAELEQRLNDKP